MRISTLMTATVCLALFGAAAHAEPLFKNSVASNDLDFITEDDPHAFHCVEFSGRDRREMPDKRGGDLFADDAFVFTARFKDGTDVGIWVHPDFETLDDARAHVEMITEPLGKLPTMMRRKLSHVVLHKGDETAFAEDQGHFFILYSENMETRVRNRDIEETVFHESVHATLDAEYLNSAAWTGAQEADSAFITNYAEQKPDKEDMAESALFARAVLWHPGRLPPEIEQKVTELIPNRLAFFRTIFGENGPAFETVADPQDCAS